MPPFDIPSENKQENSMKPPMEAILSSLCCKRRKVYVAISDSRFKASKKNFKFNYA